MTLEAWVTIGFVLAILGILRALEKWVLPRLKIKKSISDMTEAELRAHIADLERRLVESEKKNRELEQTQDFLLRQLEQGNAKMVRQDEKIQELNIKVRELEKASPTPENKPVPNGKVLWVAPRSNLPLVDAEAQDVLRSGLNVVPIFSPVSQVTLAREIRGGDFDGLWLAGHMDAAGNFQLDNGELLSSSALTSLVRGRFRWVFLNSCQSVYAAQALQNETDADVICTVVDVPDAEAFRTGSLFASAMARSGDPRAAYEQSRPGNNRIYLYLGSGRNK